MQVSFVSSIFQLQVICGNSVGYAADNLTERDYLRSEGDPGAAGYTIKEAVALTRSVVCYMLSN